MSADLRWHWLPADRLTLLHTLHPNARPLVTTRRHLVTCEQCLKRMTGTWWPRVDVAPHGTLAAARRHYRNGQMPLRWFCESCDQAVKRASKDRYQARKELAA